MFIGTDLTTKNSIIKPVVYVWHSISYYVLYDIRILYVMLFFINLKIIWIGNVHLILWFGNMYVCIKNALSSDNLISDALANQSHTLANHKHCYAGFSCISKSILKWNRSSYNIWRWSWDVPGIYIVQECIICW